MCKAHFENIMVSTSSRLIHYTHPHLVVGVNWGVLRGCLSSQLKAAQYLLSLYFKIGKKNANCPTGSHLGLHVRQVEVLRVPKEDRGHQRI